MIAIAPNNGHKRPWNGLRTLDAIERLVTQGRRSSKEWGRNVVSIKVTEQKRCTSFSLSFLVKKRNMTIDTSQQLKKIFQKEKRFIFQSNTLKFYYIMGLLKFN